MIGPEDIKENAEGTVQPPAVPADSDGGTEQPAVEPPAVPAEAKTGQDAGAPAAEAKKAPLPPAKEKVQNASLKNGVIRIRKAIRRMKKKAAARSSSKAAGKTGAKSAPKKTAAKTTQPQKQQLILPQKLRRRDPPVQLLTPEQERERRS